MLTSRSFRDISAILVNSTLTARKESTGNTIGPEVKTLVWKTAWQRGRLAPPTTRADCNNGIRALVGHRVTATLHACPEGLLKGSHALIVRGQICSIRLLRLLRLCLLLLLGFSRLVSAR